MMNKKGSIVDLFLFMILGFVVVVICGMFVYVGNTMEDELRDNADKFNTTSQSGDELITETFGAVNRSYNALPWITFAFIMAYVLGILVSGYFITVKSPVYFVPYIIIVIVAVIVSAPISNVYEEIIHNPTLVINILPFHSIKLYLCKSSNMGCSCWGILRDYNVCNVS